MVLSGRLGIVIVVVVLLLSCCSLWLVDCDGDNVGQEQDQNEDQGRKQLMEKAIETHNGLRALHSAVPLTWDNELEASARRVADSLIKSRRLTSSGIEGVGENVAGFRPPRESVSISETEPQSESEPELKDVEIAFNSIMDWYTEGENFDWTNPDKNWMNGVTHFSQIVWNSTRYFGMVVVTEPLPQIQGQNNNGTQIPKSKLAKVVVAHYKPPGNIPQKFTLNVFPRMDNSEKNVPEKKSENGEIKKSDTKTSENLKEL